MSGRASAMLRLARHIETESSERREDVSRFRTINRRGGSRRCLSESDEHSAGTLRDAVRAATELLSRAGTLQATGNSPRVPPSWMFYFEVFCVALACAMARGQRSLQNAISLHAIERCFAEWWESSRRAAACSSAGSSRRATSDAPRVTVETLQVITGVAPRLSRLERISTGDDGTGIVGRGDKDASVALVLLKDVSFERMRSEFAEKMVEVYGHRAATTALGEPVQPPHGLLPEVGGSSTASPFSLFQQRKRLRVGSPGQEVEYADTPVSRDTRKTAWEAERFSARTHRPSQAGKHLGSDRSQTPPTCERSRQRSDERWRSLERSPPSPRHRTPATDVVSGEIRSRRSSLFHDAHETCNSPCEKRAPEVQGAHVRSGAPARQPPAVLPTRDTSRKGLTAASDKEPCLASSYATVCPPQRKATANIVGCLSPSSENGVDAESGSRDCSVRDASRAPDPNGASAVSRIMHGEGSADPTLPYCLPYTERNIELHSRAKLRHAVPAIDAGARGRRFSTAWALQAREMDGSLFSPRARVAVGFATSLAGFEDHLCHVYHAPLLSQRGPFFACQFGSRYDTGHLLAAGSESGVLALIDTRKPVLQGRYSALRVHHNAIFDVELMLRDTHVLTGSGDTTIAMTDIERETVVRVFGHPGQEKHAGSVKSIHAVGDSPVFAAGCRGGRLSLWDSRQRGYGEAPALLFDVRRSLSTEVSITAVQALRGGDSVLFGTDKGGGVQQWDTRAGGRRGAVLTSHALFGDFARKGGIASMQLDRSETRILVVTTDNRVVDMPLHTHEQTEWRTEFPCITNGSFYVKACYSPCSQYILSGSCDGMLRVWDRMRPEAPALSFGGHSEEVTAVSWSPTDAGKVASCSDDHTLRVWCARDAQAEIAAHDAASDPAVQIPDTLGALSLESLPSVQASSHQDVYTHESAAEMHPVSGTIGFASPMRRNSSVHFRGNPADGAPERSSCAMAVAHQPNLLQSPIRSAPTDSPVGVDRSVFYGYSRARRALVQPHSPVRCKGSAQGASRSSQAKITDWIRKSPRRLLDNNDEIDEDIAPTWDSHQ